MTTAFELDIETNIFGGFCVFFNLWIDHSVESLVSVANVSISVDRSPC